MQNPFNREQINNYVLFYVGIIAIMVLFYILNTYLNPIQVHEQKVFDANVTDKPAIDKIIEVDIVEVEEKNKIRLLDKAY